MSNEVLIGTDHGVVRAYTIKRQDEEHQWSGDKIKALKETPQQPDPSKPGLHIPIKVTFDELEDQGVDVDETVDKEVIHRRLRVSKDMLRAHGYTENCEGCKAQRAGPAPKNHSERCRSRIVKELEKTEEGSRRIREESKRIRKMEEDDRQKQEGFFSPNSDLIYKIFSSFGKKSSACS